ncbi:hypothetical protein L596_002343 [Steinernema carpocapsae]|uniref:Uncharacterized protein n=1 Tax=Steinernema carpocapsae TaxID=34508 RepID=A0A4U8UQ03_STECR|nr:hypothetical protein L596_002343 [Steinernema carpocapsae]
MRWFLIVVCCAGFFLQGTSSSVDAPVIEIVQDERIPDQSASASISEQNDDKEALETNKIATGRPSLMEYPITESHTTPKSPSASVPFFSVAGFAPVFTLVLMRLLI